MGRLFSIKKWSKDHIAKKVGTKVIRFLCKRDARTENCTEIHNENLGVNTCTLCLSHYYNDSRCDNRENNVKVGSIIQVPKEVAETGKIKIVADQRHCKGNILQPGVTDWDFKAVEYDPDNPNETRSDFNVTTQELEEWRKIYGY